jgi:cell division protein FtsB
MKRLGFILMFLFILYFIFLIRQDIIDNLELKQAEQRTVKKLAQEQELARKLQDRLKEIDFEKLARTRLGLIKKGETAYKVIVQ